VPDRRELPDDERRADPPARVVRRLEREDEPSPELEPPDRRAGRRGAEEAMGPERIGPNNGHENEERSPEGLRSV